MRVVVCRELGPPESLSIEEWDDPVPGPGQLLVDVHAAGVNFVDGLFIAGQYQIKPPLPFTPGSEVAGVVRAVGEGVERFAPDDRVVAMPGLGGFAEALVVGEAFGLDPGTMVDVFNSSTGKSNATEVKGRQFVVSRTFAAGFTAGLMAKDLRTAGDVASHLGLDMPVLRQSVGYWADAVARLGPAADHTEIFRYAEMLAGEGK